ncbi:MAG: hypothetical protein ACFBRM_15760, partial [Pikeienuella sp.]
MTGDPRLDDKLQTDARGELWELIPWFVTGTLTPDETARIEAEAGRSAPFAAEIAAQRRLAAAVREIDAQAVSETRSWEALTARIAAGAGDEAGGPAVPPAPAEVAAPLLPVGPAADGRRRRGLGRTASWRQARRAG